MEGNLYAELINRIRKDSQEQSPATYRFGTVINTNPITISVAGITLSGSELMINAHMLKDTGDIFISDITGDLTATVNCNQGAIDSLSISGGSLSGSSMVNYSLTKGDTVLLLPIEEEQRFIILCKVVSL